MKDAYTTKEIADGLGIPVRSVTRRAQREGWASRSKVGRGGGFEWLVDGLPDDVKTALTLLGAKTPAPLPSSVVIPDWAYRIGMARFRLVMEWREYVANQKTSKGKGKGKATEAFMLAYNTGQLLPDIYEVLCEISYKTLYRWDKQLRDNGDDYTVLCDGRGKWKRGGNKGLGQIGREAEEVFLGAWLTPNRPSVQLAYRSAKAVPRKRDLPVPSYASFKRFASRFDEMHHDLVVLKREGEKALKDHVGPYNLRNPDLLSVGDVLFCDGHTLNFQCIHPTTGKPFRPTLICWFDWRSRMPVGWEIMPTEDTVAISSALHMSVRTLGQYPRCVYLDNGRAFKGKYFSEVDSDFGELDGLYARLGIGVQYSRPYEARTKIVERWFRTFDEQCQRVMASYIGNCIENKPAWARRNEKYHESAHNKYVPTLEEAGKIFWAYVMWYGQQEHRGIGNQRPLDLLNAGLGEGVNMAELDRHFLFRKQIMPQRCGFTIAGVRFESDALYGLNKPVMAMYNWADMAEIHLHTMEGERIGTARPTEALHPLAKFFGDELDLQKIKEANTRQRQLKSSTVRLAKAMDIDTNQSGLFALPFVPQRAPLKSVIKPKSVTVGSPMDDAERARLETLQAKLKVLPSAAPERPAFFADELEKYEWCFEQAIKKGLALSAEDQNFMRTYEASDEYSTVTGARFEQLMEFYAAQTIAR